MSSGSDADAAALAAQVTELYQEFYDASRCVLAAIVMVFYEHIVTFDREARLVWGRKMNGATVLFILTRYLLLIRFIIDIPSFFPLPGWRCAFLGRFSQVVEILPFLISGLFASLRAYAIGGRKWPIALPIFVLSIVPIGIQIYTFTRLVPYNFPSPVNCAFNENSPVAISNALVVTSRSCIIAADAMVLLVTWISTYHVLRAAQEANLKASFGLLILRDGTIYFVVLMVLNSLHIIVTLTQAVPYVEAFADPIASILICRFLLNLRDSDPSRAGTDLYSDIALDIHTRGGEDHGELDTIRFAASFVDPLGAPLDHGFSFTSEPLEFATQSSISDGEHKALEDVQMSDEEQHWSSPDVTHADQVMEMAIAGDLSEPCTGMDAILN